MAPFERPARVFCLRAADGTGRLDATLRARLPGISRRDIAFAIATGIVTVNAHASRKGQRVVPGDRIDLGTLVDPLPFPADLRPAILYADTILIALDKPTGIPAVARRLTGRPSIAGYLLHHFPELADVGTSLLEAGLVHRLDSGTSGVLIVARSRAAWNALRRQFRRRAVRKEYVAVVHGCLRVPRALEHDLVHDPRVPGRMTPVDATLRSTHRRPPRSWHAVARAVPLDTVGTATLIRVQLTTGVTHQIRTQLAAVGHPVVGDELYGGLPVAGVPTGRQLLHAAAIRVAHPTSGAPLVIRSPLPRDFSNALRRLAFKKKPPRTASAGVS